MTNDGSRTLVYVSSGQEVEDLVLECESKISYVDQSTYLYEYQIVNHYDDDIQFVWAGAN